MKSAPSAVAAQSPALPMSQRHLKCSPSGRVRGIHPGQTVEDSGDGTPGHSQTPQGLGQCSGSGGGGGAQAGAAHTSPYFLQAELSFPLCPFLLWLPIASGKIAKVLILGYWVPHGLSLVHSQIQTSRHIVPGLACCCQCPLSACLSHRASVPTATRDCHSYQVRVCLRSPAQPEVHAEPPRGQLHWVGYGPLSTPGLGSRTCCPLPSRNLQILSPDIEEHGVDTQPPCILLDTLNHLPLLIISCSAESC